MALAAVRPATLDDVAEIARIQLGTWRLAYAELLPAELLSQMDTQSAEAVWRQALSEGPGLVYVATEGQWTVGFCAILPAPEEEVAAADGALPEDAQHVVQVGTLLVEPRWGRRGHGGRLLGTAAAAYREKGGVRGIAWVPQEDKASLSFYRSAGWDTDGTVRTLDAGGRPLREYRLTGSLELQLRD
ncbi:GNAT family N-acetyltransferase [Allokutzneria oryzae]|uniref:GNAT family N-acetyltransferase n=1 Tax=Allokutzneria oryzae TaxID=1378989 RepID=A0ABV6A6G3_9PSEU